MKLLLEKLKLKLIFIYSKINAFILTIMVLGIIEIGVYFDLLISMMGLLAPELAPILIVIFIWILYKGIKRLYENSKNHKYFFI
ncbi:hypothetical protein [Paenibacillus roseipurpureus]|uniref:Uncharacterized protein n=1 Tax=Paenibacillus roseopurpureus TaxID=2918901 RepID=A0AA96LMY6_9BACL|nr:hypothetical protein [Paenibacillus sp. MBLB1832]WNR44071.1 hypothetical protein MJB10_23720 [Paenibacillus sp. MBLB1832]